MQSFEIFFFCLTLCPLPLPWQKSKLWLCVLCVSPSLTRWKTVKRVYPQRSQVSPRVAQCVVVIVFCFGFFFPRYYEIRVCVHVNSPLCWVSQRFSPAFSLLENSWKRLELVWNGRKTFSCGLTPLLISLLSPHTRHNYSTRQLPTILLGCTFCSFNLVF